MATQRMSKNDIQKQQIERNARNFVKGLFVANGFFFNGGELPDILEIENNKEPIVGMKDYQNASNWYNDVFTPIWRKMLNNQTIDIVRKSGTIKRQYIKHMKVVFDGPFTKNIENRRMNAAAWKEFQEAYEFYLMIC